MPAQITSLVQLVSLVLAGLALIMGAYLLIIGRRPWRGEDTTSVAPRVRLLGLSYILVFGSAMIQIVAGPGGPPGGPPRGPLVPRPQDLLGPPVPSLPPPPPHPPPPPACPL